MDEKRPNPDALLKRVQAEESRQLEGKLKIFFGANPGVGKTYAMLEAAHEQRRDGVDVVIGVVETHGRAETEALVNGLELVPRRAVDYRGTVLQEFDLDAALARRPTLILIDEGWKALDDPVFAARIRDWMKTLRKRNAIVGFGTQSARDALDSSVSAAIIEQAATQIFMPNPRATAADYCEGFGLTEQELSLVQSLPQHARCFLVKRANASVVVRLDLSSMPDMLVALSGRESSVRLLDDLRRRHGDHPSGWWAELVDAPYPGAAPARAKAKLQRAMS